MTTELLTQTQVQSEFCFYLVEYRMKDHTKMIDTPIYINSRCIFRAEYANALHRQSEICRNNGTDVVSVLNTLNHLLVKKFKLPSQFHMKKEIIKNAKKLSRDLPFIMSKSEKDSYKESQIIRFSYKHSLLSYLIQKEDEMLKALLHGYSSVTTSENNQIDYWNLRFTINVLRELDNTSASAITFNEAVDALYEKTMRNLDIGGN